MSDGKTPDIRSIFKSVNSSRHKINVQRDNLNLTEQMEKGKAAINSKRIASIEAAKVARSKRALPFSGEVPANDIFF